MMASFKTISLASIHVGERARPVDEEHALAIAASMAERGLINPITVRATPATNKGKTPYTLVAGGHRHRGAELNQWSEIDALVVEADAAEAQLIELSENLFRNELSALDRGLFVVKFREIFEEKHGKINSDGGRPKKQCNDCTDIFAPGKELSERVQERLGFGRRTYFNVTKIGLKLHPSLRQALRGTDAADDQKLLLKLAGMPDSEQAAVAGAMKVEPNVYTALALMKPELPKVDPDKAALSRLISAWDNASPEVRAQFRVHMDAPPVLREVA
ncbi:MAG: ParB N-terminal domain-containing protein [Agrobacterium cavarae]